MRISDWSSDVCSSDLATESAPIKIPYTNTGEVRVVGMTAGREVIFFKKSAGYEEDIYPTKYDEASSITVAPTTKTLSLGGTNTATLVATVLPPGANQAEIGRASCRDRVCPYV